MRVFTYVLITLNTKFVKMQYLRFLNSHFKTNFIFYCNIGLIYFKYRKLEKAEGVINSKCEIISIECYRMLLKSAYISSSFSVK